MHYLFCPLCGEKLTDKDAGDDGGVPYCNSCKRYWFDTFASASIVLVANENHEVAMLKQHYLSEDYWTYVAGYIKPGETAEETALREVEEELGLKIQRLEYAGTYWHGNGDQLMHGFIGFVKKEPFVLSSEVNQAEWVPCREAPSRMFPEAPGNSQQPIYRHYLEITGQSIPQG